MKYISYYTMNTPYECDAGRLEMSFLNHNLDFCIYRVQNFRSWEKNCQYKAKVIRGALDDFKCPVVYTDIDSEVLKDPVLFNGLDCDFASGYIKYTKDMPTRRCSGLLSGTMFFNYNQKALDLLDRWIEKNETNYEWDQRNLEHVLDKRKLDHYKLPDCYCKIFDSKWQKCDDPVILHHQKSRIYKRVING